MSGAGLGLNLSGIPVRLERVPDSLVDRIRAEWEVFVVPPPDGPFLTVRIGYVEGEPPTTAFAPKEMLARSFPGGARFEMPEGWVTVDGAGRAVVGLLRGLGDREYYTLLNLVRASLAWILPNRGGCLLHAAGLVVEERGFVLVGPAGSGKSTWARLGEQGGGRALSDDLVLIDGIGPDLQLLGAPFRSTHEVEFGRGRWPLAALFFPAHGEPVSYTPSPPVVARARLTANLTFVVDCAANDPRVVSVVERMATELPCGELRFAQDTSFVETLRDWPALPDLN